MPSRTKRARKTESPSKPRHQKSRQAGTLTAGQWFEKLVAVQKRLRAPRGCPWDREQTHATLRTYLIEEVYETLDALDSGDDVKFADEMGDLLLQVVFHSEIAREQGRFSVSDVVKAIHDKMVRRHPHVFGNVSAKNSAQVLRNWERIKAEERRDKERSNKKSPAQDAPPEPPQNQASLLDGVSRGLPAMLEGLQLTRKAARAGFDWHDADGIFEKLREEMAEVRHALTQKESRKLEEELGDLLFAAVNLARFVQVDPEIALKKANAKFQRRFVEMERSASNGKRDFAELPREAMESLWDSVKHRENNQIAGTEAENSTSPQNTKSLIPKTAASHTR